MILEPRGNNFKLIRIIFQTISIINLEPSEENLEPSQKFNTITN